MTDIVSIQTDIHELAKAVDEHIDALKKVRASIHEIESDLEKYRKDEENKLDGLNNEIEDMRKTLAKE